MTGPRSERMVKFGDDRTKTGRATDQINQSSLTFGGASSGANSRDEIIKAPAAPPIPAATQMAPSN